MQPVNNQTSHTTIREGSDCSDLCKRLHTNITLAFFCVCLFVFFLNGVIIYRLLVLLLGRALVLYYEPLVFFRQEMAQAHCVKGTHSLSCHDVGKIFYLSAHTAAALVLPHCSPIYLTHFSGLFLPPSLHFLCHCFLHLPPTDTPSFLFFCSFTLLSARVSFPFSVNFRLALSVSASFEPTSHVGERPLKAEGSSCHR